MLYPKNTEEQLSKELFKNPSSEYRGTPFWAWNGKLEDQTLIEQIDVMQKMGFGGFHMHVRTGMDSPYLNDEFMHYIKLCTQAAKDRKMLAWLYDEDRWPSGTAGGIVTAEHPEYANKLLLFTATPYSTDQREDTDHRSKPGSGHGATRHNNGSLLAVYDVVLNSDGTLKSSRVIQKDDTALGTKWYAYLESSTDDPWFNDHPYVDTLNRNAIQCFLDTTHEKFNAELHEEFGKTVPAIFTDEPQFTPKKPLPFADSCEDVFLPWTDDIVDAFDKTYSSSLLEKLPELIWELPDKAVSVTRYRFHNLVADRFVDSFCRQIGTWCSEHGIQLTGHVMGEPTLNSQTQAVGDAMRCYSSFGIPGIDMLCDRHEYNTAKQTQSIVHQQGADAMLSELYGVTGWDYDFRGYKLQGDWQAALGVTVRVPHLAWMTMKGEAKRDYPASINYQSPWWDQFSIVEDHFSRLNTAMTRGKACVKVGIIHPIESYWLSWGPSEQTAAERQQLEETFEQLTETLLFGLIDFDFISEACLPDQCAAGGNPLTVGCMQYDTIIVCGSKTLRKSTVERLNAFKEQGGKLIFVGKCPEYIDAEKSSTVRSLYDSSINTSFDRTAILDLLSSDRFIDIHDTEGIRTSSLIYQLRDDNSNRWLFIANGKNPVSPDVEPAPVYTFSIHGEYTIEVWDTLTGTVEPMAVEYANGCTIFRKQWFMHDSLLLKLAMGRGENAHSQLQPIPDNGYQILKPVNYSLDEPNMLLLDMAEASLDGGEFSPLEEILRLDNKARIELDIPLRRKEIKQPYLMKKETYRHSITLRYTIPSRIDLSDIALALEEPENVKIVFNGQPVESKAYGWFVDKSIETVKLPPLHKGENTLLLTMPFGERTNIECCYLLGDFGVKINGIIKTIIEPERTIGFGTIVNQGLPFYTGNITYECEVTTTDGALTVRVPHYRGAMVKVYADGKECGSIVYSPYTCVINGLTAGKHTISLKLYGNRQNGFAQLHHTQGIYFYMSPNSWRSAGDYWTYEYQFKPLGIMKSPEFFGISDIRAAAHITDTDSTHRT